MVRVMKSPNMMSTTGLSPVIAAPTPTPVNPASEIGVSITRSEPNSSTNPESTLNGVPASATSSPKIQTRASRRISSASASRTACAKVISRLGINVLLHLIGTGIRRVNGELHRLLHFLARFRPDVLQRSRIGIALRDQPAGMQHDGIALRLPVLLFLLGAVVLAIDVAHVVAAITISIGLQECRTRTLARPLHQPRSNFIHRMHVLTVNRDCFYTKRSGTTENG